jgi:hypothetical protein
VAPGGDTITSTLMRAFAGLSVAGSSSPSTIAIERCVRAVRICCAVGLSGLSWNFDSPALAMSWPVGLHRITSLAGNCSRNRSSARGTDESGTSASCVAALRVLFARSFASASSVTRPRFRPASSAPSTFTSNQLSIDRDTNWYDTK